jgi:hypothetical protein
MAVSVKELHRRGYSEEDIALARITQDGQRRTGSHVQSLPTILSGKEPARQISPEQLTARQLQKRGRIGGAALLLDQEALAEPDIIRKTELRQLSAKAKKLAEIPRQLEFNFFNGNWSVSNEYWDTIRQRLHDRPLLTPSRRNNALAVLGEVIRHVGWKTSLSTVTGAEIARHLRMQPADVSRALALLEDVGGIYRVEGRSKKEKAIHLNPEAVYRGPLTAGEHCNAVEKFATVVRFPGTPGAVLSGKHE